jgi:hypothetical protein
MKAQEMLRTHPGVSGNISRALVTCIEECLTCAQTCTSCADACLAESSVEHLRQCIRLNLDCADICSAAGALLTRRTGSNPQVLRATLELCAFACRVCAEECARHGEMHEHCRVCAEVCRACQKACHAALPEIVGSARAPH